jgi:hypothetical protein
MVCGDFTGGGLDLEGWVGLVFMWGVLNKVYRV